MKTPRACIHLGLSLLIIACSTISVSYDYDREADFTILKTYDWLPVPPEARADGLIVKRITNAVDRELEAKGFTMMPEAPDFHIAIYGERLTKLDIRDRGYDYGPYRYRGYYWPEDRRRIEVYQYDEGTLILDLINAQTNELIWRGTATAVIDPYATPEQRDKRITEAVGKILSNFPPDQKR
ncbi:MAG: DUF4136 domain-containing protein [Candidatus Hydrogenedentota bacterium]|nr:MAG: DUF4136 domain-containing protein [Candidatus Hydrogenedentota bacterium]